MFKVSHLSSDLICFQSFYVEYYVILFWIFFNSSKMREEWEKKSFNGQSFYFLTNMCCPSFEQLKQNKNCLLWNCDILANCRIKYGRSDNFRMNLWGQHFSQNTNKKLVKISIQGRNPDIFCSYFGGEPITS